MGASMNELGSSSAALNRSWAWIQGALIALVMLASCAYLWSSLESQVSVLGEMQRTMPAAFWPALAIGCLGTLLLGVAYHVVEIRRLVPSSRARTEQVALAYALGQIARYIPGKVIGVIFQAKLLEGRVPSRSLVLALVVQTLYDYAWAVTFCGLLIWAAVADAAWIATMALVAIVLVVWLAHSRAWCERMLVAMFPKRWSPILDAGAVRSLAPLATTLLALVWIPLLAGLIAGLHGEINFQSALQLGCYYILASMASLLVVIVPSGIALREAIFVWLGREAGAEPAMLVFLGIGIRVCLTGAEIGTALLCAATAKLTVRHISNGEASP